MLAKCSELAGASVCAVCWLGCSALVMGEGGKEEGERWSQRVNKNCSAFKDLSPKDTFHQSIH